MREAAFLVATANGRKRVERLGGRAVGVVPDEEVAYDLSRAGDLAPTAVPAIVRESQVEQFETAIHGGSQALLIAQGLRSRRAPDFAPDVRELLDEGQFVPAARPAWRVTLMLPLPS